MKKTIIITSVAIATLFAFSSCQKENLENNGPENSLRIITAEFENNATKTTLNEDGKTPEWEVGDVIRILSSSAYQDVTLAAGNISNNKITFATTLIGTLYAVYPASATSLESCTDGNISFTIPAIQDGSFASANICVAKSGTDDETNRDNLTFRNATAVLKITTADDVVGVDITATNNIAGTVTASFDGTEISLTTSSLDRNYVSAVGTSAPAGNVFYLAVAPGTTGSTKVNCYKTNLKGLEDKSSKDLQRNVIYSMDLSSVEINNSDLTGQRGILNGHEFVIIKAKYDGTNDSYLKWATMNIGATTLTGPTSYGDYFMWGAVEKPYSSLSGTFTFYSEKPSSYINNTWNASSGFDSYNCNFTKDSGPNSTTTGSPSNVFTKYTASENAYAVSGIADGMTVLESCDDAATCNWGSTWRMPSGGSESEFKALFNATYWLWDNTDKGYYVYAPNVSGDAGKYAGGTGDYDKSNALLFFPATGQSMMTYMFYRGQCGAYWSRTLDSNSPHKAFQFTFDKEGNFLTADNPDYTQARSQGETIRPVSD
ncbi:MAG: hypothetical protein MJY68_09625 [Bacteroidaceae bacterium]|nr:hypothetical protein [Bacteroidaceae bacterium]